MIRAGDTVKLKNGGHFWIVERVKFHSPDEPYALIVREDKNTGQILREKVHLIALVKGFK